MLKLLLVISMFASILSAQMYQSVPKQKAKLLQKGDSKLYCTSCGMNLVMFYKTSHALSKHHQTHQYCSLHCLVSDNKNTDLDHAKVVDAKTLKFIDAKDAHYVIGSKKPGTMTKNSKYAFLSEDDAKAFAKANGGKIVGFKEAVEIAYSDLKKDNMMIEKKRTMASKKGAMMYEKLCNSAKVPEFHSYSQAKTYIVSNNICGKIKDKQAQAIAIFLVKKNLPSNQKAIDVPKDAKCPVCGMFVAKYPKWAAQMITKENKTHYFDGIKDLMKFYFDAKEKADKILVTDYYKIVAIDAKKAWYVTGSNVYGPMGNELIAFSTKEDAQSFKKDHFGEKILSFDEITPQIVFKLRH